MDNSVFMKYLTNGIKKFVRKHQLRCGIMSDEELKAGSILVVIGQSSNISSITSENKDIIRRK